MHIGYGNENICIIISYFNKINDKEAEVKWYYLQKTHFKFVFSQLKIYYDRL